MASGGVFRCRKGALLVLALHANAGLAAAEVPRDRFESGVYLTSQRHAGGIAGIGIFVPLKWARVHSAMLEWRVEASASYYSKQGSDWRELSLGPGFRYQIDENTSITPFLRLGTVRSRFEGRTGFAYGADALLERSFTIDDGAGAPGMHRQVIVEMKAGFMTYTGAAAGTERYGLLSTLLAYDGPLAPASWDDRHRKRLKAGIGFETRFGAGRATERMLIAELSLRSEEPQAGTLLRKLDLSAGFGSASAYRLTVGYAYGF